MRRTQVLAVAAIVLVGLAGCGSSKEADRPVEGGTPKVASLATASATPSASTGAQRPRERLDTTPEEYQAMLKPYEKCMQEHGARLDKRRGAGATKADLEKNEAANRICEPQYFPLPPWEKDPANPQARDFAVAVVACLKEKGVRYVEVTDDGISLAFGGERNDARSIRMGLDLAPECERTVAATMK
ncbi:hypothetical protein [Micromonospora sp. NBS 11-29]|uniref:hypothetical protein n=1 Tax=Micromonospora sp. NBS 11-29 TaxID=1960879 RepID=UPI000B792CAF|nr:hypothetical protein [Micromonospora sp. NBS 11-29]